MGWRSHFRWSAQYSTAIANSAMQFRAQVRSLTFASRVPEANGGAGTRAKQKKPAPMFPWAGFSSRRLIGSSQLRMETGVSSISDDDLLERCPRRGHGSRAPYLARWCIHPLLLYRFDEPPSGVRSARCSACAVATSTTALRLPHAIVNGGFLPASWRAISLPPSRRREKVTFILVR